jgi:hypothetical protein
MAELVIPMIIAAGVVETVSVVQQGRAAREQGAAQAAIAERNAQLAERQAEAERQAATEAAKAHAEEGEELLARQRALFAKGGVMMRGTPLSVVVDTAEKIEQERLTILREGRISAAQARGQADIERLRGKAAKARGRAAGRAATLQAGGTILTTIGQAGYMKYRMGGTGGGTTGTGLSKRRFYTGR